MTGRDVSINDYNTFLVATLERFDAEKAHLLTHFDAVKPDQAALCDLRRELVERQREISMIAEERSTLSAVVQEEREKVARLFSENASLIAQAEDDRNKIASLLRMKSTAVQEDRVPLRIAIGSKGTTTSSKWGTATMSLRSLVSGSASSPQSAYPIIAANDALRVVAQPQQLLTLQEAAVLSNPSSGLVTALSKEVETLKTLLDEQRVAYEHDRIRRVMDSKTQQHDLRSAIDQCTSTIEHLQGVSNEATVELCQYRHQQQIVERGLRGEIEILRVAVLQARQDLSKERSRKTADLQIAVENSDHRAQDNMDHLREEFSQRKEVLLKENEQLHHNRSILQQRVHQLEEVVKLEKKNKRRAAQRHNLDTEGLHTEINLMKQHLRAVEKKVYFSRPPTAQLQTPKR